MLENLTPKLKKTQSQPGYFHVAVTIKHKDANVMLDSNQTYYASETTHTTQNPHRNPIQFIEFTYCNDKYSPAKIQEKTNKYLGLINDIKARGWNVDPLITLTACARGSTHKNTITKLKRAYSLPKDIIEPTVSQLNIIAIKYAMNILLFKRKLENNQPLPLTIS
jgi:hypothetical protein